MAIHGISDGFTTWRLPVWEMELPSAIFVTAFMSVWFGFLFIWIWMALRPLQTIRMDGDDVKLCFGPLVLRRMAYGEVKTVVRMDYPSRLNRGRYQEDCPRLILSDKTMEELLEKAGVSVSSGKNRGAHIKNYMRHHWRVNRFYLEWTEEAEEILREELTTSVFIV